MGIYVNGMVAFGVRLTEDNILQNKIDEYDGGIYELFDELFEDDEAPYKGLSPIAFGSYEYPYWVISIKHMRSLDWECSELDVNEFLLSINDMKLCEVLQKFCEDYDVTPEFKWWFGGQYG